MGGGQQGGEQAPERGNRRCYSGVRVVDLDAGCYGGLLAIVAAGLTVLAEIAARVSR